MALADGKDMTQPNAEKKKTFISWIDEDYLDPIEAVDILQKHLNKFSGLNLRLRDNGIEVSKKLIQMMS